MEPTQRGNIIPVENETISTSSRTTKEGKFFTYTMTVVQQPIRARACGAGAKSSADRRPVDPPPIVELKILEGEVEKTDITFNMNANYFLFATLEQARPIAHGRVPEDKSRLTVLTGTPVAGMVYLERPTPAGYFIFPDLSVRHEGKYRLSFSLYEELKHAKDDDRTEDVSRSASASDAHVTHRLEVKSEPFVVFSAKKFPGLTESTALSRTVAEQGCRVRIRRDVRMRRRDTKTGKDWDDYEGETAQARARMSSTPDPLGYPSLPTPHGFMDPNNRPKSTSNASHHSLSASLSRRPSLQDMNQGCHQGYGTAPHTPQGYNHASPFGPSPGQQFSQPTFMQQSQQPMQPPPMQYQPQTYPVPPPMPMNNAAQPGYYGYPAQPPPAVTPQPHYPPPSFVPGPQPQRQSVDYPSQSPTEQRRSLSQYSVPPSLPQASFVTLTPPTAYAPNYQHLSPPLLPQYASQRGQQHHHGSQDGYVSRPPPLQPIQPPARATGATTPLSARSSERTSTLPPLQIPEAMSKFETSSPSSHTALQSSYYTSATPTESHKRSYGNVFNERHLVQPLRQGVRPSTPFKPSSSVGSSHDMCSATADDADADADADLDLDPNGVKMLYRRADGSSKIRALPPHCYS